jgi:hypothetical protein
VGVDYLHGKKQEKKWIDSTWDIVIVERGNGCNISYKPGSEIKDKEGYTK